MFLALALGCFLGGLGLMFWAGFRWRPPTPPLLPPARIADGRSAAPSRRNPMTLLLLLGFAIALGGPIIAAVIAAKPEWRAHDQQDRAASRQTACAVTRDGDVDGAVSSSAR